MNAPEVKDINRRIGERLRVRRVMRGMSQDALAKQLGLTFQQVQKYEQGASRVSASRLHRIAEILDVPIGYFFAEGEASRDASFHRRLAEREVVEIVRAFTGIGDPGVRHQVLELVRAIRGSGS